MAVAHGRGQVLRLALVSKEDLVSFSSLSPLSFGDSLPLSLPISSHSPHLSVRVQSPEELPIIFLLLFLPSG